MRNLITAVVIASLCVAGARAASAQSFEVVADFGEPEGMQPLSGLVRASDGFLYGTTSGGGTGFGTIFRISTAGALTTLHVFRNSDGARPEAALIEGSDGNFYGTTRMGGAFNKGVVFKFNPAGAGTLTVLRSFNTSDGAEPRGRLVQAADGQFYGTTYAGGLTACGIATCGTIFRISATGAFTTIVRFNKTNGGQPQGGLTEGPDGRLYGTTSKGGAQDRGTVFATTTTGAVTTLHSFIFSDGFMPTGGLVRATDGFWYGTTMAGGALLKGTVFRVGAAGGLVVRHSFTGVEGANPRGDLLQASDGQFYGTASMGGLTNQGTIFRLGSLGVASLRSLSPSDGISPYATLAEVSGVFYGATSASGPPGSAGTIFRITSTGAFTRIRALKGSPVKPYSALTVGADGVLRGTTYVGGGFNKGTVYAITDGAVDLIHAFSGGDGANPIGGVVQASDGTWHGAASSGGASLGGSVYKTVGATTSRVFSLGGAYGYLSYATPVQAFDGNMYATAFRGGPKAAGTIFRVSPGGVFTVAHTFTGGGGGANPYAGLTVGPGDVLFGTTMTGGSAGLGTVYSFDAASGQHKVLASFTGANGSGPRGDLLAAQDGYLYGTTVNGGAAASGVIFRVDPATGALVTLFSFNGPNGANPYAGLIEDADGLLYGTTYTGGASIDGTVFRFDPRTRTLVTLHSFKGSDGAFPHAKLVQGPDLALYGTTTAGGASGNGVVFRIMPSSAPPPPSSSVTVKVDSPNGGEVVPLKAPLAIRWSVSGDTSAIVSFDVQFSSNGGSTFVNVPGCTGLSKSAVSCSWASASPATKKGRIRVIARQATGQTSDDSNANFTIATVKVTAPNTIVNWGIGSSQPIKWSHNQPGVAVKIEVSRNGGSTWELVAASAPSGTSAGTYNWLVTGPETTAARIRVSAVNGAASDVSNVNFKISTIP